MDRSAPIEETLRGIEQSAKRLLHAAAGSHDWAHTLRVERLCARIGPEEGADPVVLTAAAFLHDIGRSRQDETGGAVCHAAAGADLARPLLAAAAVSAARTENILHCIRTHRFRGDAAPRTIEAKVLFDADKLDAIGAVGVARAYLFAGEVGAVLHEDREDIESTPAYSRADTGYREYLVKLRHIRKRMLTPTGRRLAEDRHAFMEAFFRRFLEEWRGIC
jgi:uncharacterized protein